jgi:uncharacterized membrane protein YqjE
MAALAGGLVALVLGIIGIIVWWGYFIKALMAGVPAMLILGGALAAYLGFEEIRDKRAAEAFDSTGSEIKGEVDSLKKELEDLKKEKEALEGQKKEGES